MGGGPGTPELAAAVSNAGGLGFLAGGYLTPEQIAAEASRFRSLSDGPFGINLFAGGYHETTAQDPAPILALLADIHRELELPPPELPRVPPNPFAAQLDAVIEARPTVFSFTFGIPDAESMQRLRDARILTFGTATNVAEAVLLADAGVDRIIAQGAEAGAHRGTFAGTVEESLIPVLDLVAEIKRRVSVPVIASGGIMDGGDIARALRAGAEAVQMGTAFLACAEAGTSRTYRDALLRSGERESVITRAYSGRAARSLCTAFIERVAERDERILPYPIQNSLTRPMRAAAASRGNPEYLSLYAGTGAARIRALPAAELMELLVAELAAASG